VLDAGSAPVAPAPSRSACPARPSAGPSGTPSGSRPGWCGWGPAITDRSSRSAPNQLPQQPRIHGFSSCSITSIAIGAGWPMLQLPHLYICYPSCPCMTVHSRGSARQTHVDGRQRGVLRRAADDAGVQHDQLDQLADLKVAVDLRTWPRRASAGTHGHVARLLLAGSCPHSSGGCLTCGTHAPAA
jgi:hypothetical protein